MSHRSSSRPLSVLACILAIVSLLTTLPLIQPAAARAAPPAAAVEIREGVWLAGGQYDLSAALARQIGAPATPAGPDAGLRRGDDVPLPLLRPGTISGGAYHTCGIKPDGSVACWGLNDDGQAPATLAGPFVQISAGGFSASARKLVRIVAP